MLEQIIDENRGEARPHPEVETGEEEGRYVVHLPSFEGPLDLLLYLIEKRQMEITTISLVAVTDQYLAYLQRWQVPGAGDPPLANMAAFVLIAARLLFIKSQSLLPRTAREEAGEEAEDAAAMADELRRHLLEYKMAKEIAQHLRRREEAGLQTYARSSLLAGIEAQLAWAPPTIIGMDTQALVAAFVRLLELRAKEESNAANFVPLARVSVRERIAEIVKLLSRQANILLADLLDNESSRLVIIVTFLAVLEMWKRERVTVKQDELFSSISLQRGARWSEAEKYEEVDDGE